MKKEIVLPIIIALGFAIFTFFLLGKTMNNPAFQLTSSSFKSGSEIPRNYTCDGENISPHLRWNAFNNPNLKSYVLIVDDPDAPTHTFVHWIVLMPPTSTELSEGVSFNGGSKLLAEHPSAKELLNNLGNRNYGGPCPPHGKHTYRFTLFATNEPIDAMDTEFFKEPFSADEFSKYMGSKIIAESSIVGTYARTR